MTAHLEEEERQLVLMALAWLSVERPGWEYALSSVASKMDNLVDGRPATFYSFRDTRKDDLELMKK